MDMETGLGQKLKRPYPSVLPAGDVLVCQPYGSGGVEVFDVNGTALTDTVFNAFPSATEGLTGEMALATDQYLWVTTGAYHGYIDYNGRWLYRESRHRFLSD